ncbi:50S ribosomal protein L11 methyltransferase [Saccharibacillus sp. CPCC 101409]|uniref:50S ribosomal protein L11 methyltransferase n=1 Tax=Saccharibacillus sp. CPCC 101409 TaxID=3058041 RepID=UPI002671FEE3|nr:50S ribosomal protein L11 methyltransferase [Saccharibacillus sp. CPCC 101409]MDO3409153.1 50S ribosomal protein L11 methyltransferase [Saccharibacillus sp. CPCC 101409]
MLWHELTIHTTEEAVEAVSNFLHEAGAGGVSIEESGNLNKKRERPYGEWFDQPLNDIPEGCAEIKGYFSEETDIDAVMEEVQSRTTELETFDIDTGSPRYEKRLVDEEEWATAWKAYYKPLRVSETLTVKPVWEEYEASENEKIIELDPGMAFGTGTHPTTMLCLRTLESIVKGGEDVIDVGTGSGILSIGAIKLGAKRALAIDLDPVAVSSAKENVELNGLSGVIDVRVSDLLSVLSPSAEPSEAAGSAALGVELPVQIVVANILAEIILLFTNDVYEALRPGGLYLASGIYKDKEQAVIDGLVAAGLTVRDVHREEDWLAIVAEKVV